MKKIIFILICFIFYGNVAFANSFYSARWWRNATIEDVYNELEKGNSIIYLKAGLDLAFIYSDNINLHKGLVDLIRNRKDADREKHLGRILIISSKRNLNSELIKMLIESNVDINFKLSVDDGYTALMYAVSNNNAELVQQLLDAKADVDIQSDKRAATALMFAAAYDKDGTIVQMLIDAKANPYLVNRNNKNALNIAYNFNQNKRIAEMIKRYMIEYSNE